MQWCHSGSHCYSLGLEVNLIIEGEAVHGENLFHQPEEVLCWGGLGWAGLEGSFACCHALVVELTSKVTSMQPSGKAGGGASF